MVSERGRQIHAQVEYAREKEQDFQKALNLANEAMIAYQEDGDLRGFSEVLQSRSSVYKHLYQKTGDQVYLILAKHDALSGIEIAEGLEDKSALVMVYRGLGKILEELEDWEGSSEYFGKAIEIFGTNPPEENNRPSVLSDMKAHFAYALYQHGKKGEGLEIMDKAIEEMRNDTTEKRYNLDVWLSGAHMRAAKMLSKDDPTKAKEHLRAAEKIISSNPETILRQGQLQAIKDQKML